MIRLKAVVLPDPFGPISAVTLPSSTAKLQPSTAATPPNRLRQSVDAEQGGHGAGTGLLASGAERTRLRVASRSASEGRIPRGSSSITSRNTPE